MKYLKDFEESIVMACGLAMLLTSILGIVGISLPVWTVIPMLIICQVITYNLKTTHSKTKLKND